MRQSIPTVHRVAVVGAGISGIAAAKHLVDAGLSVVVFERASSVGGIWVYDERLPPEPPYPNISPSIAEAGSSSLNADDDEEGCADEGEIALLQARHAPSSPAYVSLKNNIPTCLMSFRDQSWPEGTKDYTSRAVVLEYVRVFAKRHDIEGLIQFNTRVLRVSKQHDGWSVVTCILLVDRGRMQRHTQDHHFDAVVVCNGHHSAPKIPDIPGLAALKRAWPRNVMHSHSYRRPQDIVGENIVLIGNGASAYDIAHELKNRVTKLYQVTKVGSGYIPLEAMPPILERVAEIAFVEDISNMREVNGYASEPAILPSMRVHLIDGTILENIHSIVLCTGYIRSYPFLTQYHDDQSNRNSTDETTLVTDGIMVHNLHKDIFYIPEPTLAFVGISTGTTSLALFEYQAIAIAHVLTGTISIPSEQEMRAEYETRLVEKGSGRPFHNLMRTEVEYVQQLVEWVNGSRNQHPIEGYSEAWLAAYNKRQAWLKEVFSSGDNEKIKKALGRDAPGVCSEDSVGYLEA